MKMISEFVDGDHVSGQYLVSSVTKGTSNTGMNYMSIELRDASGQISGKKWDSTSYDETTFVSGNVVQIEAECLKYKEALQLKILSAKMVPIEEVDVSRFVKAPPVPKEELVSRFYSYVESVNDPDCKLLLNYFINKYHDKLFEFPAGVSVHHEYSSGLLVHVTTMAKIADSLIEFYGDVNRDILITGILLHDVGKLIEFEGPIVFKYSLEGKLLGHISIMSAEIKHAAEELKLTSEVPLLLQHMILSHHGQPDFGSPVLPMTKEAIMLSMIDNLDSKLVVTSKALETVNPGEFTQKIYPLDGRTLYKPKI